MNDISLKLHDTYIEIEKLQTDINKKISIFITKANELVEMSENDYQIEKTLNLNKISLKSYMLDSPCCKSLKENNISNYSIEELANYLIEYEKKFNENFSKYYLALSLYKIIENIEKIVDYQIEIEINVIRNIIPNINDIRNAKSSEIENIYDNAKRILENKYQDKDNVNVYNIFIKILNDIFNYYTNGYPIIPNECLYKSNDS